MTIVFKLSENLRGKVISYYEDMKKEKTPPYAVFQAQDADVTREFISFEREKMRKPL